ncbi:MAG: hypothetical protein A2Y02_03065 [Omnitrophica bacterium GWA2_52_12]|nr:MAG: hypothetical protein A2Y02_03065 [Omnitrophica bacterium GWA2_52_12]
MSLPFSEVNPDEIPPLKTPGAVPGIASKSDAKPGLFRLSIRFKLTFPVLIFVSLMTYFLFNTTFRLVRQLAIEKNTSRLLATAEVYAETLKVPLLLNAPQDVKDIMEWMGSRSDVLEVRLEDSSGKVFESIHPEAQIPEVVKDPKFNGVFTVSPDTYAAAVPLMAEERNLGRVVVLFSHLGFDLELKNIFFERLVMAFAMMVLLALLSMGVTWLAIRPIFALQQTVRKILAGNLNARARIRSFDEIEDLGEAFNEMVSRLSSSLDRLRSRTEALEESEEKFRQIVEGASDIIFAFSGEGELMLLNRGFAGHPREEFFRQGFSLFAALNSEDSRKVFEAAMDEVCRRKEPMLNVPLTCVNAQTEEEIFYLLSLTPLFDHDGNLKLLQGMMRDVTELRRVEMMKDSLIRDVTHELKTPAAKFQMTVDWLEKELDRQGLKDSFKDLLKILHSNIDRLMNTVSSVMDLSKLESGSVQIDRVIFDLREVLQQVFQDLEPLVRQKGLALEASLGSRPLMVSGDKNMLYRLFSNLIGNSLKFTPRGKIMLRAFLNDGKVRAEVEDTGVGIEPEFLESIFERFVQKTAASLGIGVGLTICRDIARLHEARIWAESEGLGKGAIIKLEFLPQHLTN